jgi:hypothetical protein
MFPPLDLDHLFKYHTPRPDQLPRYEEIRRFGKAFAKIVVESCPPGPDTTTAVRKIREAVMTANAAIALEPAPTQATPSTIAALVDSGWHETAARLIVEGDVLEPAPAVAPNEASTS